MRIEEVVWLPAVVDKLAQKHDVSVEEVEDILHGVNRTFRAERGYTAGEDLYAAYGQTSAGRYLVVFYVAKAGGCVLVISAREQSQQERHRYGRK